MAQDFLYTQDGDLAWVNGGPLYSSGTEELKQALMSIIQTPIGLFMDGDVGMNFDWLLGGYDKEAAIAAIKTALMQDKRVISVISVIPSLSDDQRTVTFNIIVSSTLGKVDFSKEVDIDATDG